MKKSLPDSTGHFGHFGGSFVSDLLMEALHQLIEAYEQAKNDPEFMRQFHGDLKHYVGRETPLYHAKRFSDDVAGAQIYFKTRRLKSHRCP